jgi:hypothetical protein
LTLLQKSSDEVIHRFFLLPVTYHLLGARFAAFAAVAVGADCAYAKFTLTSVNKLFILLSMIKSFADAETQRFYTTGKTRRFSPDILKRAIKRLTQLDAATLLEDLRMPP